MLTPADHDRFARLAHRVAPGSTLFRAWELKGGVSAQVTALEIRRPGLDSDGSTEKYVVRRHGSVDLQKNPNIAADEFRLLQILQSVGIAAPAPLYLDPSGEIFPTPYLVIKYVEGSTDFTPHDLVDYLRQLATHLARIHAVDPSQVDLSFLPYHEQRIAEKLHQRPATLDDSLDEGRICDVLESAWPLTLRNPSVLMHGDFWPGNLLWRDGQLVAVIDWEDAKLGDPLADLANTRLELLWAFGLDALHEFTDHYRSLTAIDFANLPYWDLTAALKPAHKLATWGLDPATEAAMRDRHHHFVTHAFNQLSRQ